MAQRFKISERIEFSNKMMQPEDISAAQVVVDFGNYGKT